MEPASRVAFSDPVPMVYLRLFARLRPIFAHRIAKHLNAVRVVNLPVENAFGPA
jgi:hypothetical protein